MVECVRLILASRLVTWRRTVRNDLTGWLNRPCASRQLAARLIVPLTIFSVLV